MGRYPSLKKCKEETREKSVSAFGEAAAAERDRIWGWGRESRCPRQPSRDGFERAMEVTEDEREATTSVEGVVDACQHSKGLVYSLKCKKGAIITVSLP